MHISWRWPAVDEPSYAIGAGLCPCGRVCSPRLFEMLLHCSCRIRYLYFVLLSLSRVNYCSMLWCRRTVFGMQTMFSAGSLLAVVLDDGRLEYIGYELQELFYRGLSPGVERGIAQGGVLSSTPLHHSCVGCLSVG